MSCRTPYTPLGSLLFAINPYAVLAKMIVPRACLGLVTVRKGYVRLPSRVWLPSRSARGPLKTAAESRAPAGSGWCGEKRSKGTEN